MLGCNQCDQIGLFLKVSESKFLSKVAKIFGKIFGHFEKHHFLVGKAATTFEQL